MKTLLAGFLLCGIGFAQDVPAKVVEARTICVRAFQPSTGARLYSVQGDAERFLRKWKRYQIVPDLDQADITAVVIVEPVSVEHSLWARAYYGWATAGNNAPGLPLPPHTVLSGSIVVYDAAEMRAKMSLDIKPLLVVLADSRGNEPLTSAGKKLRKMIDEASKATASHPSSPPASH